MKKEEKAKVGRPKLADNDLKMNSIVLCMMSLVIVLSLVIGGIFSLTNIDSKNLIGAATRENSKTANCDVGVYNIHKTDVSLYWNCSKGKVKSFTIYNSNSKGEIGKEVKNGKENLSNNYDVAGTWKVSGLTKKTYYVASFKLSDGKVVNKKFKTPNSGTSSRKTIKNTFKVSGETDTTATLLWNVYNGKAEEFTVYYQNDEGKAGEKVEKHEINEDKQYGTWKISGLKAGKKYIIGVKYKPAKSSKKVAEVKFTTKGDDSRSVEAESITKNSVIAHWKSSNYKAETFTIYYSNEDGDVGTKKESHNISNSIVKNYKNNGTWKITGLTDETYYLISVKWDDGKVTNEKFKTGTQSTTKKQGGSSDKAATTGGSSDKTATTSLTLECPTVQIVNKAWSCNTNMAGAKITVTSANLAKGYNESFTTTSSDLTKQNKYTKPGKVKVTVSKSGYKSVTKYVEIIPIEGTTTKKSAPSNEKMTLDCPSTAKVNQKFTCKTNMPEAKITVTSTNLAKGYNESFTTTSSDLTKQNKYTKPGKVKVTVSKSGYTSVTKYVEIISIEGTTTNKSAPSNEKMTLDCPSTAKVNQKFTCKTNMPGAKITVTSTNLAKGYNESFTTTSSDLTKQSKYTKTGEITVTVTKNGLRSVTKKVKIVK